jgi:tetratricopeptide (TPR) repeat protein
LICAGLKTAENRTWSTEYRGLVAIHAGLKKQRVNELTRQIGKNKIPPGLFTYGAIIGVAELVDVVELNETLESNPSAFGPLCWLFKNPAFLPSPIAIKGKLGLYTLSEGDSKQVRSQLPGLRRSSPPTVAPAWVTAMDSDPAGDCLQRAFTYGQMGKVADAIRNCDKAIELDPARAEAFRLRAAAKIYLKEDYEGGIRDCTKAIQLEPDNALAFKNRSDAHHCLGNLTQAEADYKQAVAINPDVVAAHEAALEADDGELED